VSSPEVSSEPIQPTRSLHFWQLLGLLGLFLAIASSSIVDPRPAAINRLKENIQLLSEQNIRNTSNIDE